MKTSSSCASRLRAHHGLLRGTTAGLGQGVDVLEGRLGLRVGARLRELDARLDQLGDLLVELLELVVREVELGAELVDRIFGLAQALLILLRPVDLRVADVVAREAIGLGDEEHGPRTERACSTAFTAAS